MTISFQAGYDTTSPFHHAKEEEQVCEQRNNLTLKYVSIIFQQRICASISVGNAIHTKMFSLRHNDFSGISQWRIWEYVEDTVCTQQHEVSRWTSSISAAACPHVPRSLTRAESQPGDSSALWPPSPLTHTTGHNQALQWFLRGLLRWLKGHRIWEYFGLKATLKII